MADQAAIRLAFAKVHESLDELERELLSGPAPKRRAPRRRSTPKPTVEPSSEAVSSMRRSLRRLGVQA